MDLKQLDLNASEFEAKGIKNYVKSSLSVERYRIFEKLQVEFGYGRSFEDFHKQLEKSVELANKGKSLEAWNIVFNLKDGVGKSLEKSAHPAMLICSLFIVWEDEDLTTWDEQKAEEKIKTWNDEGFDMNGFFRLAANLVSGYIEILESIFQNTSKLEKELESLNALK
jgi:hypothetical protein